MKKKSRRLPLLLALFLEAWLLLSWLSFPADSPDDLRRLIRLHEKRWPQIAGLLSPSSLSVHCSAPALKSIAALNDGLILRFRWTKNHPEGYKVVVYLPDDHCDLETYLRTDTFQKMMPGSSGRKRKTLLPGAADTSAEGAISGQSGCFPAGFW